MASKGFKREDLQEMLFGDAPGIEVIEDEVEDTTRWSVIHSVVFKDLETGKFYSTGYSVGATEYQDESPFEYEPDVVKCEEVEPVEVTVIQYHRVKD